MAPDGEAPTPAQVAARLERGDARMARIETDVGRLTGDVRHLRLDLFGDPARRDDGGLGELRRIQDLVNERTDRVLESVTAMRQEVETRMGQLGVREKERRDRRLTFWLTATVAAIGGATAWLLQALARLGHLVAGSKP